ncbi:phosphomannomutase [Vibrio sp. WJH972]
MSTAAQVIAQSGIAFGTSGARGLVTDFTPQACIAFALSFMQSQGEVKKIAIAIDNRPSSPDIAQACITAAKYYGAEVDYYGVIPTPALAVTSIADGIPAIMVTGSHIPFDRNGLKFYRADGEISKTDEQLILNANIEVPELELIALPTALPRAATTYIDRYTRLFPNDLLQGKRIGIYEHSSAGRDLYAKLYTDLGAEVVSLGRSDQFVPIDTEAVAESDIEMAQAWQKEHNLDAVFSTDGDGDRPLLSDETGTYLRGDILCLLAAKALNIDALAIPVSCNTAVAKCGAFQEVVLTKIGSPYVIEALEPMDKNYPAVAGFEANGGFLLGSDIQVNGGELTALLTRDAVLPVIAVLAAAKSKPISALCNELPARFTASDRLQNFAREKSLNIIEQAIAAPESFLANVGITESNVIQQDQTDGLRLTLDDDSIVHLRPSGNAPELRCYIEAESAEKATKLVKQVLGALEQ